MIRGDSSFGMTKHRIAGRASRSNVAQAVARDVNRLTEKPKRRGTFYGSVAEAIASERGRP